MLGRKLREFNPNEPYFTQIDNHVKELLSTSKDPYIRSVLYREVAASLSAQENVSESEMQSLLEAAVYLQTVPKP